MSENIESNFIHRIKKTAGNQSMKEGAGAGNSSSIQRKEINFNRPDDSSVTACSHFAVIREKIPLTNDQKYVEEFK